MLLLLLLLLLFADYSLGLKRTLREIRSCSSIAATSELSSVFREFCSAFVRGAVSAAGGGSRSLFVTGALSSCQMSASCGAT